MTFCGPDDVQGPIGSRPHNVIPEPLAKSSDAARGDKPPAYDFIVGAGFILAQMNRMGNLKPQNWSFARGSPGTPARRALQLGGWGYHDSVKVIEITGERGTSEVVIDSGCLERLGGLFDDRGVDRPSETVTNATVAPLHGRRAAAAAAAPPPIELPDGEAYKRWPQVAELADAWLDRGLHRGGSVMAIGGGVVTDTVGFTSAVYLRGVEWLAVPTTLLAMVDAAVGGKTGINLDRGKNLIGAFWAPRLVAIDPLTLATLPVRELRAGLAEVVKAAWIGDRGLLDLLELPVEGFDSLPPNTWEELVARAVRVKASVVEQDEREGGARKALNLGHTLGHGLEAATEYRHFLHGEAVIWGLRAAAELAARRDLLSADARTRLDDAVNELGPVPGIEGIDVDRVFEHLARDKKRDDLGVGWVLPTDDGVVLDQRITADEIRAVFAELQRSTFNVQR